MEDSNDGLSEAKEILKILNGQSAEDIKLRLELGYMLFAKFTLKKPSDKGNELLAEYVAWFKKASEYLETMEKTDDGTG